MSDIDEVVPTEAAPVEQPQGETKESAPPEAETPDRKDEEVSKEEAKEERKFTQAEMDEAIKRRLARDHRSTERRLRAELENEYLRKQVEIFQKPQEPSGVSGEPKPEQFKTYEEYIDSLTDWKLERKLENMRQKEAEVAQQTEQQRRLAAIRDNLTKAADKYEDFEEVVESIPAQHVTTVMRDAIGESELASDIAYYLGTHHDEAARIAQLSPVAQVKAIDKLESKLKEPTAVSKAPPPAEVVKGKAKSAVDLESMSLEDYMKMRAKQGARWAK